MPDNMIHLTTRVPAQLLADLDALAKQRRMNTGDDVRRADLVREALENMAKGGAAADQPPTGDDYGALVLDTLAELANEADRRGLLDEPTGQDIGMAIWPAAGNDPRLARLQAFTSKIHGALRAV